LAISVVGVTIDRNLASRTGNQSLAWMQNATVLIQFPLGLVATAISFAILPNLSSARLAGDFESTLAFGLKLVLLLVLPAAAGLALLSMPVVGLLFEHGAFTPADTAATARALELYAIGLPFAAVDQPLVFAFYARKNTLVPNLVAGVAVAVYIVVALALIGPLGYLGLVLANSAQLISHALVMLYLTQTRLGDLKRQGMANTTVRLAAATAFMSAIVIALQVPGWTAPGFLGRVIAVALPAAGAVLAYWLALRVLRVREADQVWSILSARFSPFRSKTAGTP
jgi:putative peptidoglycan lipid II flippase